MEKDGWRVVPGSEYRFMEDEFGDHYEFSPSAAAIALGQLIKREDDGENFEKLSYGALHIVVADLNIEDENIRWCREQPEAREIDRQICDQMLAVSEGERATALAYAEGCLEKL